MIRSRTSFSIDTLLIFLISAAFLIPVESLSQSRQTQNLFKIERSKNANIVQYDVRLKADGKLDSKKPVVAYWIKLASDGRKEDLKWIERTYAYGFSTKYDAKSNSAVIDMAANIKRKIKVYEVNGEYRAEIKIDGGSAFLDKIVINSTGKGISTEVRYMELFGKDVESGEDRYEKFEP